MTLILCATACTTARTAGSAPQQPGPSSPAGSDVFSEIPGDSPTLTQAGGRWYMSWDVPRAGASGPPPMVLARIDMGTGEVAATNTFSPGFVGTPLFAAGSIWVTDSTSLGDLLLRLDPVTLMVTGELRFSPSRYAENANAAYAGGWLWLDGGDRLLRVSPSSVETTAVVPLGTYMSNVGASADGSALVVSEQGYTGAVQLRNPQTGALLASHPAAGAQAAVIDGFAGSGVWITEITGMSAFAERLSAATMAPSGARQASGPNDLTARVADGLLWVTEYEAGGPARNYCAAVDSGRQLAPLPVTSLSQGQLLAVSGDLLYFAEPLPPATGWRLVPVPVPAPCR